ncbi:MAG: YceI family protein [Flavobacteriales bacterium]|nr:YceI family protein [Flavobacteriales bacterium]
MKKFILVVATAIALASCSSKNGKTESETESSECTYSVQPAYTTLEWTAFKTMAKLGVKGTFKDIAVTAGSEAGSVTELLNGLHFELNTGSTWTDNPERDGKIVQHFFGVLAEPTLISGDILRVEGTDSAGTAVIRVRLNGMEQEVSGSYVLLDTKLELKAALDVVNWEAQKGIDSLNQVCYDLHKGEDGISKLWPNVDVVVTSTLKKNCPEQAQH